MTAVPDDLRRSAMLSLTLTVHIIAGLLASFILGWHFGTAALKANIYVQGRFVGSEPDTPTVACHMAYPKDNGHYYCAVDRREERP